MRARVLAPSKIKLDRNDDVDGVPFPPSIATIMSSSTASLRIRPAIVLFGDSITQQGFGLDGSAGWCSLLSSAYVRRCDVLKRGFSGYNTRHCLEMLARVFGEGDFLFCTVLLGANDAALPGERQHVPIGEYQENLTKIVVSIR